MEQQRESLTLVPVFDSGRPCNQQWSVGLESHEVMQPLRCFLVAPLQLINEQQQRSRTHHYRPSERFEKVMPLPTFTHRGWNRQIRMLHQQFRQNANAFG